jgi:hypothetical protein
VGFSPSGFRVSKKEKKKKVFSDLVEFQLPAIVEITGFCP